MAKKKKGFKRKIRKDMRAISARMDAMMDMIDLRADDLSPEGNRRKIIMYVSDAVRIVPDNQRDAPVPPNVK